MTKFNEFLWLLDRWLHNKPRYNFRNVNFHASQYNNYLISAQIL